MVDALTILVNGLTRSALYALVAIGFTLIFGVGGVLNLAHGASIAVGAFGAYYATNTLGLGIGLGLVAGVFTAAAFAAVLYVGMIRYVEDDLITVMILTLVTAVAIEYLLLTLVGSQARVLPSLVKRSVSLGSVSFPGNLLAAFVISWLIIGGLFAAVNYSDAGRALLATSMSRKGAALVGVEAGRVNLGTWMLAGALAGVAGVFLGSFQGVYWTMGRTPLVLSFTIVVLGGVGSIKGSVIGAYLIGFIEVITTSLVSARLAGLVPLLVLVAVLLVKPEGLFGREVAH